MNLDLACATLAAVSAFALVVRDAMLAPANTTYPRAPFYVRTGLFFSAICQGGVGWIFFDQAGKPGDFAGPAELAVLALFAGCAVMNAALLVNIATQRYRPEVWARLNRAAETVKRSCGRRLRPVGPIEGLRLARRR